MGVFKWISGEIVKTEPGISTEANRKQMKLQTRTENIQRLAKPIPINQHSTINQHRPKRKSINEDTIDHPHTPAISIISAHARTDTTACEHGIECEHYISTWRLPAGELVGRVELPWQRGSGGAGSGECGTPASAPVIVLRSSASDLERRDARRGGEWGGGGGAGGEGRRKARTRARPHGYSRRGFALGGAVTAGVGWVVVRGGEGWWRPAVRSCVRPGF